MKTDLLRKDRPHRGRTWSIHPVRTIAAALALLLLSSAPAPAAPAIRFDGSTSFQEPQLRDALRDSIGRIEADGLTPPRADDAAFYLRLFYQRAGFPDSAVDWAIESGNLILSIHEGTQRVIESVEFAGAGGAEEKQRFEDYLLGPTRARFSRFRGKLPVVESELDTGARQIEAWLRSEGYLNAVVQRPEVLSTPKTGEARVVVRVEKGRAYRIGTIETKGDEVLPRSEWPAKIQTDLAGVYSEIALAGIDDAIERFYQQHGYFAVSVEIAGFPGRADAGAVPVRITVAPGPVYTFGNVNLDKVDERARRFLSRRIGRLEGRPYARETLQGAYREVIGAGILNYFRVYENPRDHGTLDLDVVASEAKTKSTSIFLGYDTTEGGIVRLGYSDRNLLGSATSLLTTIEATQLGYTGNILHRNPWLADGRLALVTEADARVRDYDGYSVNTFRLGPALERKWNPSLTTAAFLTARRSEITTSEIDPGQLGPTRYTLATFGVSATYDRRDDPVLPGRGFLLGGTAGYSGSAEDISFARTTARATWYLPAGTTLLALGARAGIILTSSGVDSVPINERFFSGGPTTVRSFPYRDLGPGDSKGNPVGGLTEAVFNIEYTIPLIDQLKLALFADAGSVTADSSLPDDFRYALGAGLRYNLPIGPLRIDYGWNPDRREGEPSGTLHFGFGVAF